MASTQLSRCLSRLLATLLMLCLTPLTGAFDLDPDSNDSIMKFAKQTTSDLMSYYNGHKPGGTPGLLPQPYYWWEAGAMMGSLVDYWYYTGDTQYNDIVTQALQFQVGEHSDYMPRNQTLTEGNDDQGFWALAVMSAAEYNFPNPDDDKPQWLALAQAVFNTQAARWDTEHCGGGLRWQIFKWNQGWDYKNSISQGCFFALGARLALYTGNTSYADWAERAFDWTKNVGFIQDDWSVIDGAHTGDNCTDFVPYQFSYNAGTFILGAAAMYNLTESPVWKERLEKLLEAADVFFQGPDSNIMTEVACEPVDRCNLDQQSFKAYVSRWLAAITKWAPDTYETVMPWLRASAVAAAKQCVGGSNGRMCGLKWSQDEYDGTTGVGQQMAAMEVALALTIKDKPAPFTEHSGGTSKGNPGLGGNDIGVDTPRGPSYKHITAGDKAGAAILTMLVLGGMLTGVGWLMLDETSEKPPMQQFKDFNKSAATGFSGMTGTAVAVARGRGRNKETGPWNEKTGAVAWPKSTGSISSRDSRSSAEYNQAIEHAPVKIGRVRSETISVRRLSNMPLGWPQNRQAPGSQQYGIDRSSSNETFASREFVDAHEIAHAL